MENPGRLKNLAMILLVAVIFSLSIVAYTYYTQKEQLEEDYGEFRSNAFENIQMLNKTIIELTDINQNLTESLESLHDDYERLYKNYVILNESYYQIKDSNIALETELDQAFEKIRTYRREINSSLEWFNENAKLPRAPQLESKLERKCINNCEIKLGCLYLVNEQMGFSYIPDYITSGEEDQLQSLESFMENEGGDCEDYSLFFKAEFNHLKENCNSLILEAYKPGDKNDRYFLDFNENWYIDGVEPVTIPGNFRHANVICGKIYDLNRESLTGHCIVGFSREEIKNVDDLENVGEMHLVEPQNGMYYGKLNDESSGIYLLSDNPDSESFVTLIITDYDLFLYSQTDEEWLSYSLFDEQLGELQERLNR